jgi:hypothetical protein
VLIGTLVVASVVLVLWVVWYAADLSMLVFAGVLPSIVLRPDAIRGSGQERYTPNPIRNAHHAEFKPQDIALLETSSIQ